MAAWLLIGGIKRPTLTAYLIDGMLEQLESDGHNVDRTKGLPDTEENLRKAAHELALEWASMPAQYQKGGCAPGQSAYCDTGTNSTDMLDITQEAVRIELAAQRHDLAEWDPALLIMEHVLGITDPDPVDPVDPVDPISPGGSPGTSNIPIGHGKI